MACSINLRTHLLNGASTEGTWTYNGYSASFDGNEDNLAQFGASGSNPPEELPTAGQDLSGDNPAFDSESHDTGYYSFTYSITSDTCSTDINRVLPVVDGPDNGIPQTEVFYCDELTATISLWEILTQAGALEVDTDGYWIQIQGGPNPHSGFYTGGNDPTLATFDLSSVNYPWDDFPFMFQYILPAPTAPNPYTLYNCDECLNSLGLVIIQISNEYDCCTGVGRTFTELISNETMIFGFELEGGSFLNNFVPDNPNPHMNFPYSIPADNAQLTADLTDWLQANGGGFASMTPATPPWNTLRIIDPCIPLTHICLNEGCDSQQEIAET
jgi:hypothetical protein